MITLKLIPHEAHQQCLKEFSISKGYTFYDSNDAYEKPWGEYSGFFVDINEAFKEEDGLIYYTVNKVENGVVTKVTSGSCTQKQFIDNFL